MSIALIAPPPRTRRKTRLVPSCHRPRRFEGPALTGARGGRRGLGFAASASKVTNGITAAAPGGTGKSNEDFKKMFLEGKKE